MFLNQQFQFAGNKRKSSPLNHYRGNRDKKDHVKYQIRILHLVYKGVGGKNNRNRTAQSDPG